MMLKTAAKEMLVEVSFSSSLEEREDGFPEASDAAELEDEAEPPAHGIGGQQYGSPVTWEADPGPGAGMHTLRGTRGAEE